MSKLMKKPFAGKPGGKPNGPGNQKNKNNFAKKNGVHKPNPQNIKKAVQQKNQKQNQNGKPNQKNQPQKGKHFKKNVSLEESVDEEVNEGVPMFKGLPKDSPTKQGKKNNQKNKKKAPKVEESLDSSNVVEEDDDVSSLDSDDLENADSDDSDSEDVDQSMDSSMGSKKNKSLQLGDLLGESLVDDDDDEEFEGKLDEEDDDDSDEDDLDDEEMSDDDDDDEDDDDSEDEEEELPHKKSKTLEMKDLLGKSIEEDDDDEEFEMDEEDDDDDDDSDEETDISKSELSMTEESPKKKVKNEKAAKPEKPQLSEEDLRLKDERTIYVGNVPKDCTPTKIEKIFKKFGKIESVRIRGVIPEDQKIADPKIARKVAYIKKRMHPKVDNFAAFVVFENKESAEKAVSMNGKKIDDHILNVNLLMKRNEFDSKKAVFLGNLPFDAKFNEIHNLFSKCGTINSLRIIRDKRTGLGKGFGYVNFTSVDAVTLALELNGTKIGQREIRVKTCAADQPSKRKRMLSEGPDKKFKKFKKDKPSQEKNEATNGKAQIQGGKKKKPFVKKEQTKTENSPKKEDNMPFAGQKADGKKKKNKPNKEMKQKKAMAKKFMGNKGGKAK